MTRLVSVMVAVSAAVAACTAGGGAISGVSGVVAAAGPWGRAIEVPGLAALSEGGYSRVNAVSCASQGNCVAVGHYGKRHNPNTQGFAADERNGRWGAAIEVPGLAALISAQGGDGSDLGSVSCGSAGNCALGGDYYQLPNITVPILATESGGQWGKAIALPADALPGDGSVNSIACASAGNCLAGGGIDGNNDYVDIGYSFVFAEQAGHWGPVRSVAGLQALERGGDPEVSGSWIDSAACPSAGDCAVSGTYFDRSGGQHGFVADERNGAWGTAIEVPGLAALNAGGSAMVASVSCGSPGNCAAVGSYTDSSRRPQGFVTVERNGTWGTAMRVPGLAALTTGNRSTQILAVSCNPAGSCAIGGSYTDSSRHQQGFVAVERNGRWGKAAEVPGLAALNTGGSAQVNWLSCPSPAKCTAGGFYIDSSGQHQGFVT